MIFLFGMSFLAGLTFLILAPGYAQRTFETNVELTLQQASIVNFTETSPTTAVYLQVAGAVVLRQDAFRLYQRLTWLLGSISIQDTPIQIDHVSDNLVSPIGTIHLPLLTLSRSTNTTSFDFLTSFEVHHPDALVQFCKTALSSSSVQWRLQGALPVHAGWLPYQPNIRLDRLAEIQGMDGLKQTEMKDMQFNGRHPLGGIALEGTVGVFNPSKMLSIALGNVNFGIYLPTDDNDELIAIVEARHARLMGGQMNYFDIRGRTLAIDDSRDGPRKQQALERFLSAYLHGSTSAVHVRGSLQGPDGQPSNTLPDWLQTAMMQLTLTVPFPGTRQQEIIQSLTMDDLRIDFSMPSMTPLVSGKAIAMLQLPPEMRIVVDVQSILPDVYLYLEANSTAPFARLKPASPCAATTLHQGDGIPADMFMVKALIDRAPFRVMPGHEAEFQKFLDRVLNSKEATIYLQGTADALIDSDLGSLNVHGLPFDGQIHTKGMQGMQHPGPKVTGLTIVKGYKDALHVETSLLMINPSDVTINLGHVTFALVHQHLTLGNTTIDPLLLVPGENSLKATGYLYQSDQPALLDFISTFVSGTGNGTDSVISGQNSSSSPYLAPLLNHLRFLVTLPPLDKPALLQKVQMNLLSSTSIAWLQNPFSTVDIRILVIDATSTYRDKPIGNMYANFSDGGRGWDGPLLLPGTGTILVQTPKIPVMLAAKPDLEAIAKALGGQLEVDVHSLVTITIDDFLLEALPYDRQNITATIRKIF
ncbi:hypothetical protein DM01DRAFT_1334551 [Hesseltinella vesiculosa]|uniref:Tag1-like fifth Ig-like domain-containing protein n=1 Tax=Hesseltinella vesiculosa TaxID=101127 RepID=A0A1X2GMC7_9FUNG|nr:hypothetical protein DM01DRAFT_1334551 [Hesseltinella vesiculosa]